MCGGINELQDGVTSGVCQYCGSLTTFPKIDDEQTERLYGRAEHFRQKHDFDKAISAYESILSRDSEDPEAYWGLVLSRYGIEYVEDPATHERIPTCHRVQYESILADPDYQNALKYASGSDRDIYEKEANRIAEIQKGILRISAQEKPYDVFICYKETTDGGTRTKDSTLAQDIYYQLTNQGLKVFFSRITLEDKLGQQYEPYIFAALNSAKVMLVIGSKREYFDAVWVKNEWSRFLALMKKDRSKILIPCYRDMDAYDIPEELSMFQSQDMSRIGFIQDILRGIMKVVNATHASNSGSSTTSVSNPGGSEVSKKMKRISVLMHQHDWSEAESLCKRALETDPENAELYLLLCMIDHQISTEKELEKAGCRLSDDKNFQVAMQFSSPEHKAKLEDIQALALSNYYLNKSLSANQVSNESELAHIDSPLAGDNDFQNAIESAPPERKRELLSIQCDQVNRFLQLCIKSNHVSSESELVQAKHPLSENIYFRKALDSASLERKQELQQIIYAQAEYFLRLCMKSNQVSEEEDLPYIPKFLKEDSLFQLALMYAAPERKKIIQRLLDWQTDNPSKVYLKMCMASHRVSSETELSCIHDLLIEDNYFQLALKCASPEHEQELHQLVDNQAESFLQKCMEQYGIKNEDELVHVKTPFLREDALFLLALRSASPKKKEALLEIQNEQERLLLIKALPRFLIITFVFIALTILCAVLLSSCSSANRSNLWIKCFFQIN